MKSKLMEIIKQGPDEETSARKILDLFDPEKIMVERLHVENGHFDMNLQHPLFMVLCNDIVNTFDDAGGINYVEFSMVHKTRGEFSVLIQKSDGFTPAQKNIILTAENAGLKEQLKKYQEAK